MKIPKVIYEDDYILGIDKPAGLLVHPDDSSDKETLSDWIVEHCPEIEGVGEEQRIKTGEVIERHGIVHRLDAPTSGVMVIAKTQESFKHLKEQFQNRDVKKVYNCFVYGGFKDEDLEGVIDREIGKSRKDFRQWSAQRGARGKMRASVTEYRVLEQGRDPESGEAVSYVEVYPKTGRTHQIRVHLKAINHQVICDPLYAENRECLLGFNRLALHARSIEVELSNGDRVKIEAEFPDDFKRALDALKS